MSLKSYRQNVKCNLILCIVCFQTFDIEHYFRQNSYKLEVILNRGLNYCCPESTFTSILGKDNSVSIKDCRSRDAEFIYRCLQFSVIVNQAEFR